MNQSTFQWRESWYCRQMRVLIATRGLVDTESTVIPLDQGVWKAAFAHNFPLYAGVWTSSSPCLYAMYDSVTGQIVNRRAPMYTTKLVRAQTVMVQPQKDGLFCGAYAFNTLMGGRPLMSPRILVYSLSKSNPAEFRQGIDSLQTFELSAVHLAALNLGVFLLPVVITASIEEIGVFCDDRVIEFLQRQGAFMLLRGGHYVSAHYQHDDKDGRWMLIDNRGPRCQQFASVVELLESESAMSGSVGQNYTQMDLLVPLDPAISGGKLLPWNATLRELMQMSTGRAHWNKATKQCLVGILSGDELRGALMPPTSPLHLSADSFRYPAVAMTRRAVEQVELVLYNWPSRNASQTDEALASCRQLRNYLESCFLASDYEYNCRFISWAHLAVAWTANSANNTNLLLIPTRMLLGCAIHMRPEWTPFNVVDKDGNFDLQFLQAIKLLVQEPVSDETVNRLLEPLMTSLNPNKVDPGHELSTWLAPDEQSFLHNLKCHLRFASTQVNQECVLWRNICIYLVCTFLMKHTRKQTVSFVMPSDDSESLADDFSLLPFYIGAAGIRSQQAKTENSTVDQLYNDSWASQLDSVAIIVRDSPDTVKQLRSTAMNYSWTNQLVPKLH